jgi:hypothetical protein
MSIDASAKLKIVSLEDPRGTVVAYFNPKEVSVDQSVPWRKRKGPARLEFTARGPKTMSFELMFDGSETKTSVQTEIDKLRKLADAVPRLKRPRKVKVIWGTAAAAGGISSFQAVIESVSVKYTMVTPDGKLVRATADVNFNKVADFKVGKMR